MLCVPMPAVAGLNILPFTPGPEYTPPAGEPPFNVNIGSLTHVSLKEFNDTGVDEPVLNPSRI